MCSHSSVCSCHCYDITNTVVVAVVVVAVVAGRILLQSIYLHGFEFRVTTLYKRPPPRSEGFSALSTTALFGAFLWFSNGATFTQSTAVVHLTTMQPSNVLEDMVSFMGYIQLKDRDNLLIFSCTK